ncbi:SusD/RagB family nutrient-binding outer membrane lipoprotein [Flavobacterium franklandianum]|uniref:SusD/RagB family nutrient-binding outer membrane lipoprotein n=1 Tax=Flavobacterium franklandianum TaxID=2594430 RepID=A0A553CR09_9FLAO|nr:SusD/RagB family nutrient-binding outer membrane lipoprotein [Flavobacterium franklandianum]TRX22917.1 SusD/RagB family nutrient-binding outer membrane lipoprotein [Flavobacterium franklandianum]TRX24937.1 SusD/RagB family nutrient-binding outer membrane lipoprotein [Flavobacterium franklandianum]
MKKISILFIALLGLFNASCDKDFEEVNTTPNDPVAVPAHLLLGNIIRVNQNTVYHMQRGGDMGMCWAQHVSKVQYNDEERYIPRRGVINDIWDVLYTGVIADAKSMYTLAESEENTNIQGISLVLQANTFQILTDLYGPVPYTEACNPSILKPAYDSQEVVYKGILDLLTKADALLANGTGSIPASSDLIYGGDASKWRKLANSLKLKVLMRISKAPGMNVGSQIQALATSGNLMSSNSDSAQIKYIAAQPDANPIYEQVVFGTRSEYKMSSVLVAKLQGLADPRLPVFAGKNNAGLYVGNIPGVENPGNYNGFSPLGTFYLSATLPGVLLSYAQSELLLAEAINEGYVSGGNAAALTHYKNGITANFAFNGITASAAAYVALPNIEFTNQADARLKIGDQKWIALFGQGFEAWTEWRRTGLPALSPVFDAAPGVPTIPSRLFYNDTENSLNKVNYDAAVGTLTGGDKLTSRLWWMN